MLNNCLSIEGSLLLEKKQTKIYFSLHQLEIQAKECRT